ncbi:MAG: Holliday junction resolvase-like protein [Anaerolineales bacterium]
MDIIVGMFFGIIVGVIVGAVLVYLFIRGRSKTSQVDKERLIQNYEQKISALQQQHTLDIEQARKQSVDQSRNTLKGKMAEQMAPLLPGFKFLPADARFLGDPIDYVVFDGYTANKDNGADPNTIEVVILDIKHADAGLSSSQRAIAKAIEDGRVRFDVVRIFDNGEIKSHTWHSRKANSLGQSTTE